MVSPLNRNGVGGSQAVNHSYIKRLQAGRNVLNDNIVNGTVIVTGRRSCPSEGDTGTSGNRTYIHFMSFISVAARIVIVRHSFYCCKSRGSQRSDIANREGTIRSTAHGRSKNNLLAVETV